MDYCQFDIMNYDHNCKILAQPCKYLDNIAVCPYREKELQKPEKARSV